MPTQQNTHNLDQIISIFYTLINKVVWEHLNMALELTKWTASRHVISIPISFRIYNNI